jgi:hypothetical protein
MKNQQDGARGTETREQLTFTTKDKSEAEAWCQARRAEGYYVRMELNEDTGYYTCTAIR